MRNHAKPLWSAALAVGAAAAAAAAPRAATAENAEPPRDKVAVESLALASLLDLESSVATKEDRPIERTPATVSVVTDDQVRDYGWLTINDVLAQLPGYARGQDFERRVMTTRGNPETWNADRTLILVDGAPFNDVEVDAAYTWEATSLAFFKKVDVLRGPASAVYGTNALNGVIGLETLTVDDLGGGGVRGSLRLAPDAVVMSAVGGQRTDLVDVVVGAASYNRDPVAFSDYDGSLRLGDDGELARFPVRDGRRHYHFMSKLDGRGPISGLSLTVHLQDGVFETGHGWFEHIPDSRESYAENRILPTLRYQHRAGRVALDHVAQLQRQSYDMRIRFYESGAEGNFYPDGVTEELITDLSRAFFRSQATVDLDREASVLFGAEYAATLYDGDELHQANANLSSDEGEPYPEFRPVGPMYQPIVDRPVHRLAGFGQLVSGEWLGERIELTAGLRYDGLIYDYVPMEAPGGPSVGGSFHEVSPRVGVVASPVDWLALKALAGRAFRTPAVIELFAANTWTAGATPDTLEPERDTTYELAADLRPLAGLRWRSNGFYSRRENHISFADGVSDVLLNLYTNDRVGVETEVLGEVPVAGGRAEGHASASYVELVDEETLHPDVAAGTELSNAPEVLLKAGARWIGTRTTLAAQAYVQGPTRRRASAMMTPEFRAVRPDTVPAFVTLDAAGTFSLTSALRLGLSVANLLDQRSRVVAPYDTGFDFRVDPRRVFLTLELSQ